MQVYAMPPVSYTTHAKYIENARSVSRGLNGTAYPSQYRKARRKVEVTVHGIGDDHAGQGYIEQLREYLDEKPPIVQIEVRPDGWSQKVESVRTARGHGKILWSWGGAPMDWLYTKSVSSIYYTSMNVVAGMDYGGNYIDVTFPTSNSTVAIAGEKIVQGDVTGRVVGNSISDSFGNARIYVDTEFQSGNLNISPIEWMNCYIDSMPPTTQKADLNFEYKIGMTEVFDSDYTTGLEVIQPWRP